MIKTAHHTWATGGAVPACAQHTYDGIVMPVGPANPVAGKEYEP